MHRYVIFLLLTAASIASANSRNTDRERLLRLVPWQIDALARSAPDCHPPDVEFIRADFDGDRSFRYVVASYFAICGTHISSAVRVLRETNGQLFLDQIPSGLSFMVGQKLSPDVIDLDNSGIPELLFRVRQGPQMNTDYSLLLFQWREGSLRPISTQHIDTRNAVFRDLDADGRLELVTFNRRRLAKSRTTKRAANHQGTQHRSAYFYRSGEFQDIEVHRTEAKLSRLAASDKEFSLAEVSRQQNGSLPHSEFVLRLAWVYDPANPVRLNNVKPETLLLGRALHPEAVTTTLEAGGGNCPAEARSVPCFKGGAIEAQFNRESVARLLPKLQLAKRIETGDLVSVPVTALMDNGDYISTNITISISQ